MIDVIVYSVVIIMIVGGMFLVNYLTKMNILKDKVFNDIDSVLHIANLIVDVINVDDKIKNKSKFVLDLADIIAEFAHSYSLNGSDKEAIALELLAEIADRFNLDLSVNEKELAKIVINESLKWLENNVKLNEKQ